MPRVGLDCPITPLELGTIETRKRSVCLELGANWVRFVERAGQYHCSYNLRIFSGIPSPSDRAAAQMKHVLEKATEELRKEWAGGLKEDA